MARVHASLQNQTVLNYCVVVVVVGRSGGGGGGGGGRRDFHRPRDLMSAPSMQLCKNNLNVKVYYKPKPVLRLYMHK